ncbi:MAG: phosphoribosylformylglycinamidine cyclo-ligase [Candidatus Cloacimonetes bacterium]|nr:phosphoribosylformylglycinamidine cyclo-ligase [Candidatus Cloacimonadota bacterium]
MDYKTSGVDIQAGEKAVQNIKNIVKKTYNNNVLTELGSFGGLYSLDLSKWSQPVMVSSTDGVGTKLIVAQKAKVFNTVGQDLVNHCVNDILVQGAHPQFFMDYIGLAQMNTDTIQQIIEGMAKACLENGMSLIGGEMAEMPGIYHNEDFDLVGTIIGLVEKKNVITGQNITENDVVIGFPSTGLHTNGYSLARKIIFEKLNLKVDDYVEEISCKVSDALLAIHRSYYPTLCKWANPEFINGMAHITGGGLKGNIKRILPDNLSAKIKCKNWETPKLFTWLMKSGNIKAEEMFNAFNMGVGFVVITSKEKAEDIIQETDGMIIGIITKRESNQPVILDFE